MRYDIKMLWVDDLPTWYNQTKEIVEMDVEDQNLLAEIEYISNCQELLYKIDQEQDGFKVYDMFFIDYALSDNITGSNIIKLLRDMDINSDILFYSSDNEDQIRDTIKKDLGSFEGVYVANRTNFRDQSQKLIKKNAKRLLSISNIRGVLMDQTSENDYIILSYIQEKFNSLDKEYKKEINSMVLNHLISDKTKYDNIYNKEVKKIQDQGITNIKKFLGLPSSLVPLDLKYRIFLKIHSSNSNGGSGDQWLDNYFNNIVTKRNTVAHKKLEICRMQKNILYYDNINQYNNRQCPESCDLHDDNNKISVEQWMNIKKQLIDYGKYFDDILHNLLNDINASEEVAATKEE